MKFIIQQEDAFSYKTDCLVLFLFEEQILPDLTQQVDAHMHQAILQLIKQKEITGKSEEFFLWHHPQEIKANRIIIVGLGTHDKLHLPLFKKILTTLVKKAPLSSIQKLTFCLGDITLDGINQEKLVQFITTTLTTALFEFKTFKSQASERTLKEIQFLITQPVTPRLEQAIKEGEAIGQGQNYARTLGNTPPNLCTPTFLSHEAERLAKAHRRLNCKIISEKELEKMGAGAFVAVSKGSHEDGKMIFLEYKNGESDEQPIVLIGKGITFDTGGISLKGADKMHEMKYDMCGAASILGVMQTVATLQLPINLVGVMACAENMPSGTAYRPGDIVKTLLGKTVEITNTDAEGRLVLCDAITYSMKYRPQILIDVATLTGACVVALGNAFSGLFCNDTPLSQELLRASVDSGDLVWPMPLAEEYMESLHSEHADFTNASDSRMGGAIVAGVFLSQFTQSVRWAHLDIAGTAWASGKGNLGATGRPVYLLCRFLLNHIAMNHSMNLDDQPKPQAKTKAKTQTKTKTQDQAKTQAKPKTPTKTQKPSGKTQKPSTIKSKTKNAS